MVLSLYNIILWFDICVHAANEFSERLSYFGIVTSLVVYLTTILHQDLKMAVRNANYWSGVTTLMPLLGGFVADAYLGRYATVLFATIIYLMVIYNFQFSSIGFYKNTRNDYYIYIFLKIILYTSCMYTLKTVSIILMHSNKLPI